MEEIAIRCDNLSIDKNNDHKYTELIVNNHCRKNPDHWRMLENHHIILKAVKKMEHLS